VKWKKARTLKVRASSLMEAEGIEPSSQDNPDGGLYMLIWCFDLVPHAGHQQSTRDTSRLYLIRNRRPSCRTSPFFSTSASRALALCRRCLIYLGSDCEGRAETDAPTDITVIGS
jgi:hypothetical protein